MLNNEEKNWLQNTSFLVTGGAGFIGSNLVQTLVLNNAKEVRVLDNLATGNKSTIIELINRGKVDFTEGDIRDPEVCRKVCKGIDIVLHQAALGSVQRSIKDPQTTNAVNIDGFLNMLVAAKESAVKKFIYASSSSVYGDDETMPKTEEKTGKLLSPYALTKKTNEEYAGLFTKLYRFETIGLRYFNVFGPNQDINGPYAAVIPLFIEAMLAGKPVTIFGDGENTRDFTFVENVVYANLKAAFAKTTSEKFPVVNIAFGGTVSLNNLYKLLSEITGNKLPPEYAGVRAGDIKNSFADISKAKKMLNYEPLIGLEEGLKNTVNWFRKKKNNFQ
ncbi:MAG TPA: SDR family oxidoreductase [Bacteroidia bacterium]|nr:SDR family oxidoreductase [Bacteroidia bacterium]